MKTYSLNEIATLINAELIGDGNTIISYVGTLNEGQKGEISFLAENVYKKFIPDSQLSALIVNEKIDCHLNLLIVSDVKSAWRKVLNLFVPELPTAKISDKALIGDNVSLGQNIHIGMGAVIEDGVIIGDNTCIGAGAIIESGVTIGADCHIDCGVKILRKTKIGNRCRILAGAVIGGRGFGLNFEQGSWHELPQLGGVIIGDDVEIGACTTVDCGAIHDTIISNGAKLDNHIQIAHNVHIGEHTVMAGCSVVAGSTSIGKYCVIGGASVITGHINVCDKVHITGHSSISKSITNADVYSSAFPAMSDRDWKRLVAKLRIFGREK